MTGINFQKASCTLDGCVKIWTSRVDSIATETGKLLSGLAGGGGGEEDAEDEDGELGEGGEPKARKVGCIQEHWADSRHTDPRRRLPSHSRP